MKKLFGILLAFGLIGAAHAQSPVITQPYPITSSGNASSTITVTNTFQSIWAASTNTRGRAGCTVQNNTTGSNNQWVFFGPIANATKGTSVLLAPGMSVNCIKGGIVLQEQVSITGTSTDTFLALQQ